MYLLTLTIRTEYKYDIIAISEHLTPVKCSKPQSSKMQHIQYAATFFLTLINLHKTFCCPKKASLPSGTPTLAPDPRCREDNAGYSEITGGGLVRRESEVSMTLCVSDKDVHRDCRFSSTNGEYCFYLDDLKTM